MKLWAPELVISLVRDRNLEAHAFTGRRPSAVGLLDCLLGQTHISEAPGAFHCKTMRIQYI
jgi:hypothetical protein